MAKFVILCVRGMLIGLVQWERRYCWAGGLETYQFVAVATAAPFVLMGNELISVGYSHGTPSIPNPNATW